MSRSRQACALLIIAFAAVACGGGGGTSENPAILQPSTTAHDLNTVTCAPSGTSLVLSADNIAYDKDCLAAPAGQAFTIAFANRQKGISHNVVILKSQGGDVLFRGGDPFPGVKTQVYNAPPLPAGEYHFHCEVHPDAMQGKFIVS
ncbi:MAG: cupredoxin domain-containing protein [Actinomycetota bacterium]|nr:cupredoxin domain-containing protein [Actinomycetota bacterium]